MSDESPSRPTPTRFTRLPVRWRWPVLAALLPAAGWAYLWPAIAFGTSYCPPGPPDPGLLSYLRGAIILAFSSVTGPFAIAGVVDAGCGARREGVTQLAVAGGLLLLGAVVVAGARPSTWCF